MKVAKVVFGLGAIALAGNAFAAGLDLSTPSEERQASADSSVEWRVTLGGGVAYLPVYQGAKEHELRALPLIDVQKGRFFLGVRGLGVNLSPWRSVEFGPRLSYRGGRDQDDSDRLRGLGDIDGAVEAGGYVQVRFANWTAYASLGTALGGGSDGTVGQIGASHTTVLGPRDRLRLGGNIEWSDRDYMQTYFGITAPQSLASGLRQYSPSSGLKSYSLNAAWIHSFSREWFSAASLNVSRLGDEARSSPIVEEATRTMTTVTAGYRF